MSDDLHAELAATKEVMQLLAQRLDKALNGEVRARPRFGFVLLISDLDLSDGTPRTNFVSNGDRKDVVAILKEVAARLEGQPYQEGSA